MRAGYQPKSGDGPTSSPPNQGSAGRHIGAGNQVKPAGDVFEEIALALGPTVGKRLRAAIDAAIDARLERYGLVDRDDKKLGDCKRRFPDFGLIAAAMLPPADRDHFKGGVPWDEPTQEEIDGVAAVFDEVADDEVASSSAYIMAKKLKRVFRGQAGLGRLFRWL